MNMEKGERGDGEHSIIQVAGDTSNPEAAAATNGDGEEITPLLGQPHKPRMTIFSVSYPNRKPPTESTLKDVEIDVALSNQFLLWIWSGSRYSGLVCMALSSIIYFFMEVLLDIFSVGTIPLFEIVFTRCAIILILSFVWMKKIGQPVFGPTHIRKLLVARALTGFISMLSFIYSIQSLPLPNAIVLSFMTPIMASIMARVILHEKLTIKDIAGLVCSIFGLLFIFQPMLVMRGSYTKTSEPSNTRVVRGNHPVFAVLVGLFSSATSGISYCLIRAGGKASDQPMVTVFAFSLLATPAAAICAFAFKEFVMPNIYSFLPMVLLGVLAFLAEIFLARGLQLEKTSKVANIQYIEAFLSQIWGMILMREAPSLNRLVGCFLILVSVSSTVYFGPEKETD